MLRSATTLELPDIASVDDDPAHAWRVLSHGLQSILDVPFMANGTFAHQQAGTHRIADAIDMFMTGDILVHTWDLARAVGLDERLDAVEVHRMYEGLLPLDAMLRTSGHYGPRVVVSDTADEQTKLIAFTGRRP